MQRDENRKYQKYNELIFFYHMQLLKILKKVFVFVFVVINQFHPIITVNMVLTMTVIKSIKFCLIVDENTQNLEQTCSFFECHKILQNKKCTD